MTPPSVSPEAGAVAEVVTGARPDGPSTPHDIADAFKEQLRDAGAESGFLAPPPEERAQRGRPPKSGKHFVAPAAPAPTWTADGIGSVVVTAHNLAFHAFDVPELEPEEEKQVAETSARFLNSAWPTGAAWEPHAAMALTELSVILPRVAAYQMARKAEAERKANETAPAPSGPRLMDKSINPVNPIKPPETGAPDA